MNAPKKAVVLALGGAVAAAVSMTAVNAAENPFALKPLASGYMVADSHDATDKMQDGKCGSGKCGSSMKKKKEKAKEGSCGSEKAKEGSCSGEKKAKEGSCGGEKAKEGSCGGEKK